MITISWKGQMDFPCPCPPPLKTNLTIQVRPSRPLLHTSTVHLVHTYFPLRFPLEPPWAIVLITSTSGHANTNSPQGSFIDGYLWETPTRLNETVTATLAFRARVSIGHTIILHWYFHAFTSPAVTLILGTNHVRWPDQLATCTHEGTKRSIFNKQQR